MTLFTVLQGFLYWAEEVTHSICRVNKHNGKNLQILQANVSTLGGVAIIQPALQPNGMTSQKYHDIHDMSQVLVEIGRVGSLLC